MRRFSEIERPAVLGRLRILLGGLAVLAFLGAGLLVTGMTLALLAIALVAFAIRYLLLPPSLNPRKRRWPGIALTAASLLLMVGVGEGVLRLFPVNELYRPTNLIMPRKDCLVMLKSGAVGVYPFVKDDGRPGTTPVRISSQGFRDREMPPKAPDEFRILMLGDSFTFGTGLHETDTIPRRLEARLPRTADGKRISVINGGCPGHGPWQELLILKERGFALEPDLVILQLLPCNDIADTLARDERRLRAYDLFQSRQRVVWMRHDTVKMRVELWLRRHSRLYLSLWSATRGRVNISGVLNRLRFMHDPTIPKLPPSAPRPWFIEVNLEEWYPVLEQGWRELERDVLAIHEACRRRGIGVLAIVVPAKEDISDTAWEHSLAEVRDGSRYERGKGVRMTEAFLARAGITYVPLVPVLKAHPNPSSLYYRIDGHFTAAGADTTAQALADYLRSAWQAGELVQSPDPPSPLNTTAEESPRKHSSGLLRGGVGADRMGGLRAGGGAGAPAGGAAAFPRERGESEAWRA